MATSLPPLLNFADLWSRAALAGTTPLYGWTIANGNVAGQFQTAIGSSSYTLTQSTPTSTCTTQVDASGRRLSEDCGGAPSGYMTYTPSEVTAGEASVEWDLGSVASVAGITVGAHYDNRPYLSYLYTSSDGVA